MTVQTPLVGILPQGEFQESDDLILSKTIAPSNIKLTKVLKPSFVFFWMTRIKRSNFEAGEYKLY